MPEKISNKSFLFDGNGDLINYRGDVVIPSHQVQSTFNMERVENGDGGFFYQFNPFGLPSTEFNSGAGAINQIETTEKNLRWYMVSNYRQLLSQMYVEFGLVQTICDVPIDDALRGGVEIKSEQLSEEQIEELKIDCESEGILETAGMGYKWGRLFGGAGIVGMIEGQDPSMPLNLDTIGPDTNVKFRAVDMWELFFNTTSIENFDGTIDTNSFNHYNYYNVRLHKSRVMRIKGKEAPSFVRPRLRGWGMSEIEKLIRSINQFLKSTDVVFEVLDEFKVDYYGIEGLAASVLQPNGFGKMQRRIADMNRQKNFEHGVVMDAKDTFNQKQLTFAGLSDLKDSFRKDICGDLKMPLVKVWGQSSAAGLSNGDDELEVYTGMIESEIRPGMKKDILWMLKIKCQQKFGVVPTYLKLTFQPMRILKATDEETVKNTQYARASADVAAGRITQIEFRDICNKWQLYPIKLDTDSSVLQLDAPGVTKLKTPEDVAAEQASQEPDDDDKEKKKKKNAVLNFILKLFNGEIPTAPEDIEEETEPVMNPGTVDEEKWAAAKAACQKEYGHTKWAVVTSIYKKMGGTFK